MTWSTKKLTMVAVLCAMAIIVNMMIAIPIMPAVPFLHYEPKDVLIVIGGFIYGPMVSFVMSGICSFLELFIRGGNIIDVLMNMISTCAFACSAALIYQHNHTKKGAMIGLGLGIILTTISMCIWNYIVTPFYFQIPRESVVAMMLPGILPFNLIKSSANALIVLIIYKPIVQFLRRQKMVDTTNQTKPLTIGSIIVITFIAISAILIILIHKGVI